MKIQLNKSILQSKCISLFLSFFTIPQSFIYKVAVITFLSFILVNSNAQSYPTVYFANVYQSDSTNVTYSINSNSIRIVKLLEGSSFRFVGSVAGTTFTPTSGNDVGGVFYYEDLDGNTFSIRGVISRLRQSGQTKEGYYFYANPTHAYFFVIPGNESGFSINTSVSTSSNFTVADLNAYLTSQVSLTTNLNEVCKDGSISALNANITSSSVTSYRFYYNTTNTVSINGATLVSTVTTTAQTASYTPSTSVVSTRYYFVQVLNNSTQIGISNTIAVIINAPPTISSYSGSYSSAQNNCQYGISTPLSVTATAGSGVGPYYQWYSNSTNSNTGGILINGATNSTFSPPTLDIGTKYYYCVVSNSHGCTTTSNVSGLITTTSSSYNGGGISGSATVCTGTNSTALTVSGYTQGLNVLRWESSPLGDFSSNVTTINSTSTSITPTNLTITTYYRAVLSGTCDIVQSTYGSIVVNPNTSISTQPSTSSQTLCQNSTPTALSVTAVGGNLNYAWYSNSSNSTTGGTLINTATSSTYLPSTTSTGSLYYYVKVSGSCGSEVTSNVSGVITITSLTATPSLSPTSISCGSSSSLSVALTGTSPWDVTYSDGSNSFSVYGITTSPRALALVSPTSSTTYTISSIVDGNFCQAFPNTTATLTVILPNAPTIGTITQPTCANSTGSVAMSGLPASGTWTVTASSGATITGTGTTGTFTGLPAGTYTFTVTNTSSCTSASSSSATIIANTPPTISSQISNSSQSVCQGATATTLSVTATAGTGTISSYKWYSNASNSSSGGTLLVTNSSSASTDSYTPSSASAGTLYYYVVVTNSNGCTVTSNVSGPVTVANPGIISASPSTWMAPATTTFSSNGTAGGTWASSNSSVATINSSGVLTTVGAGTTTISYTVLPSCTATKLVTITDNNGTLPVTWQSFTGTKIQERVLLSWVTGIEVNTKDFEVQHSLNTVDWSTLGTLLAAGNSTVACNYSFTHTTPVKAVNVYNYYRILQRDLDGKFSYSKIVSILFNEPGPEVVVYPNPVDDILNIYTATEQVVSLYNAAGSLVWKAKLPAGRNQLPVNKLSKGVYILATNQLKTRIIIR
jgi:large repetitive protein